MSALKKIIRYKVSRNGILKEAFLISIRLDLTIFTY